MAVISFINSKGGSSKTTSAVVLASTLAGRGQTTTVIDSDPLRWASKWASLASVSGVTVTPCDKAEDIGDLIEAAAQKTDHVIVDTEGTASMTVAFAVAFSDLVIVPMQASSMDAESAAQAISLITAQEKATRRSIPRVVLFSRTSAAIATRTLRAIQGELDQVGIPTLPVHLHERAAFRELMAFGGAVRDLPRDEINGVDKAVENAERYADAVLEVIAEVQAHAA